MTSRARNHLPSGNQKLIAFGSPYKADRTEAHRKLNRHRDDLCTDELRKRALWSRYLPIQFGRNRSKIGKDVVDQLDGKHLAFCGLQYRSHRLQCLVESRRDKINRDARFCY